MKVVEYGEFGDDFVKFFIEGILGEFDFLYVDCNDVSFVLKLWLWLLRCIVFNMRDFELIFIVNC